MFFRKVVFILCYLSAIASYGSDDVCQARLQQGHYSVPKALEDSRSFESIILIRQQIKILFDRELQLISRLTPGTNEFNQHWSKFYSKFNSPKFAPIYKFDRENQTLIPSERGTLNLRVSQISKLKVQAENNSRSYNTPALALILAAAKFYALREIPHLDDFDAWEEAEFLTNLYPEMVSNPKIPELANGIVVSLKDSSLISGIKTSQLNSSAAFNNLIEKAAKALEANELRGVKAQELQRLFLNELETITKYFDQLLARGFENPRSLFDNGINFAINAWDSLNAKAIYDRDRLKTLFCENKKYKIEKSQIIDDLISKTDTTVTVLGFASLGFGVASWAAKRAGFFLFSKVLNYSVAVEIAVGLPMLTATTPLEISQALARYRQASNGYYVNAKGFETEQISETRSEVLKTIGWSTVDLFTYLPGIFFLRTL